MGRIYRPKCCFSGGSRCERQWEGLCILLNNLLSTNLRYSDTSQIHVELQIPNRRVFWSSLKLVQVLRKCSANASAVLSSSVNQSMNLLTPHPLLNLDF